MQVQVQQVCARPSSAARWPRLRPRAACPTAWRPPSTHLPARGRSGATRAPSDQTALLLSYNSTSRRPSGTRWSPGGAAAIPSTVDRTPCSVARTPCSTKGVAAPIPCLIVSSKEASLKASSAAGAGARRATTLPSRCEGLGCSAALNAAACASSSNLCLVHRVSAIFQCDHRKGSQATSIIAKGRRYAGGCRAWHPLQIDR